MSRTAKVLLGVLFLFGAVAIGVQSWRYPELRASGAYGLACIPLAIGIILILRGIESAVDPTREMEWRLPKDAELSVPRPWATADVDQPFSVGEAIGVAMRVLRQRPWALVGTQAITMVVSLMHFWYDAFVWSVRRAQV